MVGEGRYFTVPPRCLLVAGDSVYTMEPSPSDGGAPPSNRCSLSFDKDKNGKSISLPEVTQQCGDRIMFACFQAATKSTQRRRGAHRDEWNGRIRSENPTGGLVRTKARR